MDIMAELGKLTGKVTDSVASKAKDSAISTLSDPDFKAAVNKFTRDWIDEHKVFLATFFGAFLLLSVMAILNIISDFRAGR